MARQNLRAFLHYVSPTFSQAWNARHVRYLCECLMALDRGDIPRLMIFLPPRNRKCMDGDSQVLMASGTWRKLRHVRKGDSVACLDAHLKMTTSRVVSAGPSGVKETFAVHLTHAQRMVATAEHRVKTFDGWKTVEELTLDDYVAVIRRAPEGSAGLTHDDAILLAVFLAEGSKDRGYFEFTNGLKPVIDAMRNISDRRGWTMHPLSNAAHPFGYAITMGGRQADDTPVAFLRRFGVFSVRTETLRIPRQVFAAKPGTVSLFLGYLWACDGYVALASGGLGLTSKSEGFIRDLQRLLLQREIRSVIAPFVVRREGREFPQWLLQIGEKDSILRFSETIAIPGKQDALNELVSQVQQRGLSNHKNDVIPAAWQRYRKHSEGWFRAHHQIRFKEGGIHRVKLAKIADIEQSPTLRDLAQSDVTWHRVVKIESAGSRETFDLEVAEHHNFIADNIVVHNSQTANAHFSAWYLGRHPDHHVITTSYSGDLAKTFSRQSRNLLAEHGEALFGVRLADDSRAADDWKLADHYGGLTAAGVGGPITGRGAHLLIMDDLLRDREEANSPTMRDKVWDWYTSTAATRLERDGKTVLIMTRWHEDDIAGRLLRQQELGEGDHWTVVRFPAEAEEADVLGRTPGEALWPDEFPLPWLQAQRRRIGSADYAALYQQRPQELHGGAFQARWFRWYTADEITVEDDHWVWRGEPLTVVVGIDPATTAKSTSDDFAMVVLGVTRTGEALVLDVIAEPTPIGEQLPRVLTAYRQWAPDRITVEDNQGQAYFVHNLKHWHTTVPGAMPLPVKAITSTGDKYDRITRNVPYVEDGHLWLRAVDPAQDGWVDLDRLPAVKMHRRMVKLYQQLVTLAPKMTHEDAADALDLALAGTRVRKLFADQLEEDA